MGSGHERLFTPLEPAVRRPQEQVGRSRSQRQSGFLNKRLTRHWSQELARPGGKRHGQQLLAHSG